MTGVQTCALPILCDQGCCGAQLCWRRSTVFFLCEEDDDDERMPLFILACTFIDGVLPELIRSTRLDGHHSLFTAESHKRLTPFTKANKGLSAFGRCPGLVFWFRLLLNLLNGFVQFLLESRV